MNYDVVIIGGGAGGLVTAVGCNSLGLSVAIVDNGKLGGDCLFHGCVPSKTLIKSAKVAHAVREASTYGITATAEPVDFKQVRKRIDDVIETLGEHDSPERFKALGIAVYFGESQFIDEHTIAVTSTEKQTQITAKKIVISTGSSPVIPPIPGISETKYITNKEIFSLNSLPKQLLVIGAGPIGIEMAQAFQRLGTHVTVLDTGKNILSREDADITSILESQLRKEGMDIIHQANVTRLQSSSAEITVNGESKTVHFDTVLLATGRKPNLERLNLDAIGVKYTNRGITVNNKLQTTKKHIYAVGDVTGPFLFTHMAEYQAGIAVWNICMPINKSVDYRVIPWVTYTDPELARVGISEAEAKSQQIAHKVYTVYSKSIDRSITEGYDQGIIKLVLSPKGKILGAAALLPNAGEVLQEYVLAMKANLTVRSISDTVHPYPTVAQANRRVANAYLAEKFLTPRTKKLARFLFRFS